METDCRKGSTALPAVERQVLLLVSLEGFSYEETGLILGLERDEVRALLHTAQEEMQRQTAASVLIIEDEHVIAMDLARIVEEMGHHLCGTASRQSEAIELSRAHPAEFGAGRHPAQRWRQRHSSSARNFAAS